MTECRYRCDKPTREPICPAVCAAMPMALLAHTFTTRCPDQPER